MRYRVTMRSTVFTCLAVFLMSRCAVVQRIDSALDCNAICERYASCFDKSYDVSACASRCRASASERPDFRRKADLCNACLTARSCVSSFACVSECVSVVP
jgi:hypothetical protein